MERTRSGLFYATYALTLAAGACWIHWPGVVRRSGTSIGELRALFAAGFLYLAVRAYLVLVRGLHAPNWQNVWLALDLVLISIIVNRTGKMSSEAGLVYAWPLITISIQRRPRMTATVGIAVALLYLIAAWPDNTDIDTFGRLGARVFAALVATAIAVAYAVTEATRVEELTRLREQVALGDYQRDLAKEMHDGIQYYLVRATTRLEMARAAMNEDPERAARAAVDQRLTLRQAMDELRYLIRRLRSATLERQGIEAALQDFMAQVQERSSVSAGLTVEGDLSCLPPDVEHAAFRVVQEALTNVEKYAEARNVAVRVAREGAELTCTVEDDGTGFDLSSLPQQPGVEGGFGFAGMRERAEGLGGRVEISSTVGEGTQVTLMLPVEQCSDHDREETAGAEDTTPDR